MRRQLVLVDNSRQFRSTTALPPNPVSIGRPPTTSRQPPIGGVEAGRGKLQNSGFGGMQSTDQLCLPQDWEAPM